jgi:hypothetical protein
MLFDLKGRRRRVIQGTYLMLAVLMGGGLVLFGIGSNTGSGGLVDAITGGGGASQDAGSGQIADRVGQAEARLRTNPRDQAALAAVVRGRYQLATAKTSANSTGFPPEAQPDLKGAAAAWERYLAQRPAKPDDSLAGLMLQAYSEFGLRRPDKAAQAAQIVAEARPSASSWLGVAQYATLAGDTKGANRAGKRALATASSAERPAVKQQLAALAKAVRDAKKAQAKAIKQQATRGGGRAGAGPTPAAPPGAPASPGR